MRSLRRFCAALAVVSVAAMPVSASTIGVGVEKPARITAVNPDGTVTATDASGQAYTFAVPKSASTRAPKPGQTVMVNPASGRVSISGVEQCCELVKSPATLKRPSAQ